MITTTFTITAPETSYHALAIKYGYREVIESTTNTDIDIEGNVITSITNTPTGLDANGLTDIQYIQKYVQDQVLTNWLAAEILFFKQAALQEIENQKKLIAEQSAIDAAAMVAISG